MTPLEEIQELENMFSLPEPIETLGLMDWCSIVSKRYGDRGRLQAALLVERREQSFMTWARMSLGHDCPELQAQALSNADDVAISAGLSVLRSGVLTEAPEPHDLMGHRSGGGGRGGTKIVTRTWAGDLVPSAQVWLPSAESLAIDAVLDGINIADAYRRWCGKSEPDDSKKRESIMVSCPNPVHPDEHPSAWLNLDIGAGGVGNCARCGGFDKYDIAAWRFAFEVPSYKSNGDFPKLCRRMAEDLGHVGMSARSVPRIAPVSMTDDPLTNLPAEFWASRTSLEHVQKAAHARGRCADAVLAAVLARVVTLIPPSIQLPAIVGSSASLNLFTAIVAASGGGKSTSVDIAAELVPIEQADILERVSPGSGEGLVEMYLSLETCTDPVTGKTIKLKRQTKSAAFVFVDEGQTLLAMGDRTSAIVLPILRSAWSGSTLGQQNASSETNRRVEAHEYRMGLVIGIQLQYAAELIANAEGGTPQRFVFLSATDPTIPDQATDWPGPLDPIALPVVASTTFVDVDSNVAAAIRQRNLDVQRGVVVVDPLDGHADLVRLKVAAVLAVMDGSRLGITVEDWELAGQVMATSCAVRAVAIESQRAKASVAEEAKIATAIRREAAGENEAETRALRSGAKSIANRVAKVGTLSLADARRAVASKHRNAASLEDMIEYAEQRGWITSDGLNFGPGTSRPA